MTDSMRAPDRIYEFVGVTGEVVGWIETEGEATRIVFIEDDGETSFIEFPRDLAPEVAEALRMTAP